MLRIFLELRFFRIYFSMLKIFESSRISLFRAIQCTNYNLWTRTVDCGLAQLSMRADHKKGRLGKPQRRWQQKLHLKIISRFLNTLCMQNAFYLCWNEIAISGLEIT